MRIDLHTHTVASDGLMDAASLIGEARSRGVGLLAVSDHDTTASVEDAVVAGRKLGVEVWPAVELSCDVEAGEFHVLGYFVDHRLNWFQALLGQLREGRVDRAARMVGRLAALGVPVAYERVATLAAGGAIGRLHVARVLVEAGYVRDTAEAFERFIGRGGPAYAERIKLLPVQAIELIRAAGGLAVLAHPGLGAGDETIRDLAASGLDGLEVYYPDHSPSQVEHYRMLAAELGLLITGGTDFHGGAMSTRVHVGSQYVPEWVIAPILEAASCRHPQAEPPALELLAG